ncbi:MAG: hypothetical protein IIC66_10505 [candidate division Zixibacteria bacterium]|nr:hypothetical protein [candidate division Zixibacteria bacterium]
MMGNTLEISTLVRAHNPANQRGAVLIFCLIFLLVLTLMAVTGMESAILDEKMAANMRDHNLAFEAAEASLKVAEDWIATQSDLPATSADGSTIVWILDAPDPNLTDSDNWWEASGTDTHSWWKDNAIQVTGIAEVASAPRYIIEQSYTSSKGHSRAIGTGSPGGTRVFYRITARWVGRSTSAVVQLQSTFVKLIEDCSTSLSPAGFQYIL